MRSPAINERVMALGQGLFYLASGLWPVVHLKSFEKVTGPKTDDWLVKTVGSLIAITGAALTHSALSRDPTKELPEDLKWIAAGEALVLGGISLLYSTRGRISRVYLLDTFVEAALAGGWLAARPDKTRTYTNGAWRQPQTRDQSARARRQRWLRIIPRNPAGV